MKPYLDKNCNSFYFSDGTPNGKSEDGAPDDATVHRGDDNFDAKSSTGIQLWKFDMIQ